MWNKVERKREGGDPLKISSRSRFVRARVEGAGEQGGGNRVGSVRAWMEWVKRESERKVERRMREELKASK